MKEPAATGWIDFIFDGSFEGLLCAVSAALHEPQARIVETTDHRPDLFAAVVHVETHDALAADLRRRFGRLAGTDELLTLRYLHASDHPDRSRLVLAYVRRTLDAGRAVGSDIADPDVLAVRRIRDRVDRELARLLGFLRFRRVGGTLYYAPASPDANVVGFLGPHFAARFPDQQLIIHDLRRDIAFWFRPGGRQEPQRPEAGIADVAGMPGELRRRLRADCEPEIEELWRSYFDRIANPERRNLRLQRKLMPARYWPTLVEVPAANRDVEPLGPGGRPETGCVPWGHEGQRGSQDHPRAPQRHPVPRRSRARRGC